MERDDVISLLQVVHAYDNRKIDELVVRTWSEAARRAHWRATEAIEAVHEHFATSTAWLMPGHITEAIKLARRQPPQASEVLPALDGPPPVSDERRAEFMAQIRQIADRKAVR